MSRVRVIETDKNGNNSRFLDTVTKEEMTVGQFIGKINKGLYPTYHVRTDKNGRRFPASNPNSSNNDNLG